MGDVKMSNKRITKFNHIVGAKPKGLYASPEEIWNQLELQSRLILEEANELYDAVKNKDILEVLDGSTDVWYLREYMDDILKSLDIDVAGAKYEVSYNNEQKYTTSADYAALSWSEYAQQGKPAVMDAVDYEGKTYYTVKIDGKVQKLLHHVRPDLNKCIPEKTKEKLNGQ